MIIIKNVRKTYQDGTNALKSVDLEVDEGTVFGLLGPNGAGKTTLISIMTTILSKTSGNISIGGYDIDKDADEIRKMIGVTFQESVKEENLTGLEIMVHHGALYGMKKTEILKQANDLLSKVNMKEAGNKDVKTYSGGMRRKLEIIKCMMTDPKVLFLDEPTLGLDPQSRREIWSFINLLKSKGTTVFVTSHYIDEIEKNADQVAIIGLGEIIEVGEPSKLISDFKEKEGINDSSLEDVFIDLVEKKGGED